MDVDSSSKSGSSMLPLGIAIFGTVLGAIGLIMSFSNSGKVSKLQSDLTQAQTDIATAKSEADTASGLSAKLNDTAGKTDQVYTYVQQMAGVVKQDHDDVTTLKDTVTKLGTRTVAATTAKGGTATTHVVSGQGGTYAVASGDNLSSIARKFNVSLKALEDANPGVDPAKLHIGQEISIPGSKPASGGSAAPTTATPTTAATTGN
ncbi:MAG TPA: LysM domain-containing protein [Opitutales bacterium]|jgi:LysM repeat protein|nr:LysM domain-containing protein [Opitutales bacterium]